SADAEPGDESERFSSYAFGAVFVEVRIDPDLGMIRVPRIIGAYDVGCVVNPKIARSQCIGGMGGGRGMALLARADWGARSGRGAAARGRGRRGRSRAAECAAANIVPAGAEA